ncbi:CDP-alcohol phosphatidyltransferase family protein [Arthrobacter agilis]|uniref:CDP-alcohol phosphatidyltransferase family protein n=1 Tax=Arthrobacter agilis TaxID=37921 RepID=UPI002366D26E|nr:CDP-alcohol phosphatidyltransferase family protein [Arthrobacter agilis]WDF34354.1 CDP-alcohol phosphatidyltransferase family protein [Arthrobacter agilis]
MRLIGAGARSGGEVAELATALTLPNLITVLRFLGVPLFVWLITQQAYGAAVITLVVMGSTDWVDGYVARRLNQVSVVGKWLDPVADRTALIVVAVTFVIAGIAPAWLVWTIVIPDVILIINALVLFRGPLHLPVITVGKIRTALLLVGAPLLLLHRVEGYEQEWLLILAEAVLAAGCVLHLVAFFAYFRAAHRTYRLQQAGKQSCPS